MLRLSFHLELKLVVDKEEKKRRRREGEREYQTATSHPGPSPVSENSGPGQQVTFRPQSAIGSCHKEPLQSRRENNNLRTAPVKQPLPRSVEDRTAGRGAPLRRRFPVGRQR